jgi:hypothetical protein
MSDATVPLLGKGSPMKRISLTFGVVAAAGLFLVGSAISPAAAVPMSHHATVTSLVYYAENRGVTRVDSDADGALEHGDMVERELALSRTLGGKVIGVSYSQGEIVAYKPEIKTDVRRVSIQNQLPGGELFATGLVEYSALALPTPGWQESYAIIGGTGKYAGARGSGTMTLLEDGKTFKVVLKLMM